MEQQNKSSKAIALKNFAAKDFIKAKIEANVSNNSKR
jgi:hypothetical protein